MDPPYKYGDAEHHCEVCRRDLFILAGTPNHTVTLESDWFASIPNTSFHFSRNSINDVSHREPKFASRQLPQLQTSFRDRHRETVRSSFTPICISNLVSIRSSNHPHDPLLRWPSTILIAPQCGASLPGRSGGMVRWTRAFGRRVTHPPR